MTRRTFGTQAALFVLGCALQVCSAVAVLKRRITDFAQLEIGAVFTDYDDPSVTWRIVDEGTYKIHPDGRREEIETSRCLLWNCTKVGGSDVPELHCFCLPPDTGLEWLKRGNFHFPGI